MPELPEVERVRRRLAPAMAGARFTRVLLNRADLRRPFPAQFARRLRGRTVRALTRRGKYLLAELSSGDMLVMHLGMSGSFRVETTSSLRRPDDRDAALENHHDHVVLIMSSGATITFNDPRRFGTMDLIAAADLRRHSVGRLGPEPLSRAFDANVLAARLAGRRIALKTALLDQTIVAGVGNIYASDALNLARLSPFRIAATLASAAGAPRQGADALTRAIKAVLRRAIRLRETGPYRESRFRVYDRDGKPCPNPDCRGTIARAVQASRATFYCPVCQR